MDVVLYNQQILLLDLLIVAWFRKQKYFTLTSEIHNGKTEVNNLHSN